MKCVVMFAPLAGFLWGFIAISANAADWLQFRGPHRDGVSPSDDLLTEWPASGPRLVWTASGAGRGYSSLAIVEGKLFTMGDAPSTADDDGEYLLCFSDATGKQLWKQRLGHAWDQVTSQLVRVAALLNNPTEAHPADD